LDIVRKKFIFHILITVQLKSVIEAKGRSKKKTDGKQIVTRTEAAVVPLLRSAFFSNFEWTVARFYFITKNPCQFQHNLKTSYTTIHKRRPFKN